MPTNPAALTQVLGVVYRTISGYVLKSAGRDHALGTRLGADPHL